MLDYVCDGLLHNSINMDFRVFVEQSIHGFYAAGEQDRAILGGSTNRGANRLGQQLF